LATLPFEILITFRSVSSILKSYRYRMASTLKAVEFDASGKPKPFSSVDERDVEPCF